MAFLLKYQQWKFLIALLMNAFLCFISGLYLVWWMIAVISFGVHFSLNVRVVAAFFSGFFSLFFLWTGLTLYISNYDDFASAELLSALFFARKIPVLFNLLSGLLGGMITGLSGFCGAHARRIAGSLYFAAASRPTDARYVPRSSDRRA